MQALRKTAQSGFTLVEIMIVVVIIGLLASIAYPSYQQYVVRSNRADAQAFLLEIAQREQQYLMDARRYVELDTLGLTTPSGVSEHYDFSVTPGVGTPPTFTATATPKGAIQSGDGNITIDQAGSRLWNGNSW